MLRVKRKDPAQLAKDCGTDGTSSNVDGTFGAKVGAGLRGEAKVGFDRSSGKFEVKGKLSLSSSAEAKVYVEVKEKGVTGMDALVGPNIGPVNYAFGVDSKGNAKAQLKINTPVVTVKTNFGEGGKLEGAKLEMGTGVSIPNVRFKKDLAETETTFGIPYFTWLSNKIKNWNRSVHDEECP